MRGTAAANNARGKTGSMSGVQALSGYVDTQDGETLTFAILANNYQTPASDVRALIDKAVVHLANFSRNPSQPVLLGEDRVRETGLLESAGA
jgi:D-alanyl-D-alanine carboxypeptidase/D-alanyl-D-alanine-endopeptidase (penicillin-binding protein 4)